jgi:hypothetical protein
MHHAATLAFAYATRVPPTLHPAVSCSKALVRTFPTAFYVRNSERCVRRCCLRFAQILSLSADVSQAIPVLDLLLAAPVSLDVSHFVTRGSSGGDGPRASKRRGAESRSTSPALTDELGAEGEPAGPGPGAGPGSEVGPVDRGAASGSGGAVGPGHSSPLALAQLLGGLELGGGALPLLMLGCCCRCCCWCVLLLLLLLCVVVVVAAAVGVCCCCWCVLLLLLLLLLGCVVAVGVCCCCWCVLLLSLLLLLGCVVGGGGGC